eukprot:NODE_321_length_11054_cov_0.461524.p4 type:complete len:285 gc:universal NODE_321_length_11054_cov_0.461524:4743-3889(-)
MQTVGFVGLGAMGLRMCKNLQKKFKVLAFDIQDRQGVTMASNVSELVSKSDVIITMLPTADHVSSISDEIKHLLKDKLWIDSSTVDPTTSKNWHNLVRSKHGNSLDAPVSGGISGAENASLTFMVGGESHVLKIADPILSTMGKNIVHCGVAGAGATAKVCNNMLLGTTMLALSETLLLGKKLGMDPATLTKIINTSSGRCWSSDTYNPAPNVMPNVPSSNKYKPGFSVSLCHKDMKLALSSASSVSSPTLMASIAQQSYADMCNDKNFKDLDFSAVYKWLEQK